MQQRFEFMDLIVAVGLSATVVASGLLLMAANGMQMRTAGWGLLEQPTGYLSGMALLQPVLGQAIVDHTVLERSHDKNVAAATTQLDGLVFESKQWQHSPYGYLDSITTGASRAEAEHTARVQTVMGRSIVNFTRRGVRSGLWSSVERADQHNSRMIGVTEATGQKMDSAFLANWQPNIGRGIVTATQESDRRSTVRQERLGTAILERITVQEVYEPVRAAIQEQLGSATVVATMTALQQGRADPNDRSAGPPGVLGTQDDRPRLSTMTTFIVTSLILVSLFSTGLFVFARRPAGSREHDLAHGRV